MNGCEEGVIGIDPQEFGLLKQSAEWYFENSNKLAQEAWSNSQGLLDILKRLNELEARHNL